MAKFLILLTAFPLCFPPPVLAFQTWNQLESNRPPVSDFAIADGGAIAIGIIEAVTSDKTNQASGHVTLKITEQLRGPELPQSVTVPFRADGFYQLRRPLNVWSVTPKVGKRVIIFFNRMELQVAGCIVLDAMELEDANEKWLPLIREMVALSARRGDQEGVLTALADGKPLAMRQIALRLLYYRCRVDNDLCRRVISILKGIYNNERLPTLDRRWAASEAGNVFFYHSSELIRPELQHNFLSALASSNADVRAECLRALWMTLGPRTSGYKPKMSFNPAEHAKFVEMLALDAHSADPDIAKMAQELIPELGK